MTENELETPAMQVKVRSDIEQILMKSDEEFKRWYDERKEATERLLHDYELVASIPHLEYESETQQYTMGCIAYVGGTLHYLKTGLKFLDAIKEFRQKYQSRQQ